MTATCNIEAPARKETPAAFEYSVEIDKATPSQWDEYLALFDDASIYQTWAYGAVSWGEKNLSHLVLKRNGRLAGIAQLRIVRVPLLSAGIAYLRWGPLHRLSGESSDCSALPELLAAIRREYATNRGLLVRIVPHIFEKEAAAGDFLEACRSAGFVTTTSARTYRTLRLDMSPPLDQIRKGLDQKWRNQLNGASRNNLTITEGTSDALFNSFLSAYRDLRSRKRFDSTVSADGFRRIQKELTQRARMLVLLAERDGELQAGFVGSVFGDTGIYLLGATTAAGMKSKASYLLQWRFLEILKSKNCRWYDLGGVNPETNPGVYHFKCGLGGENDCLVTKREVGTTLLNSYIAKVARLLTK
jgi:lipid II:glycine glycyltransferase (peptidoglycan interpeptide bridge formation enzyme)